MSRVQPSLTRFLAIAALAPAWPLSAQADDVVPMEIIGRVIFLKGEVNGKGPLNLILDTGATDTVITPRTAERVGLRSSEGKGIAKTVAVGGVTATNLGVYVFDPPQALSLRLDRGADYHGILGYTFLSRYVTTINYRRQTVRFGPPARAGSRMKTTVPPGTRVIPFEIRRKLIYAKGRVNSKGPLTFLVDTGAADTLLFPRTAEALKLAAEPLPGYPGVRFAQLMISLGDAVAPEVPTVVHAVPHDAGASQQSDGILGHPFLSNFVVTVDYQAGQLLLTPNVPEGEGEGLRK